MHIGPFHWRIPLFACGFSVVVHGALFTAAYYVTWAPRASSKPEIEVARGDQAIQVMIISTSFPDPMGEQAPATEAPAPPNIETSPLQAIAVAPLPERTTAAEPLEHGCERINSEGEEPSLVDEPTEHMAPAHVAAVPDVSVQEQVRLMPEDQSDEAPFEPPQPSIASRPDAAADAERIAAQDRRRDPLPKSPPDDRPAEVKRTQKHALRDEPSSDAEPGVETGVEVVDLPRPRYPLVSRRRGEEGLVLLQVDVLTTGRAGDIKVLRDPGFPRLTRAAIEAVRRARFRPATRSGRPVAASVRIPLRFVLR